MRRIRLAGALAGLVAAGTMIGAPVAAAASSSNTTQTTTASVSPTLSVSLSNGLLAFGAVNQFSTQSLPTSNITVVNTLNDGLGWTLTVAATDMITGSPATCTTAGGCIPFTSQSFGNTSGAGGCTVSPSGPTVNAGVGTGANSIWLGTDTTPGTTYSNPTNILTGSSSTQGGWTVSGCQFEVQAAADQKIGSYTGHLQYTVTG